MKLTTYEITGTEEVIGHIDDLRIELKRLVTPPTVTHTIIVYV